jgi:V/A-type H+-transporting ATPase subunit D
MAFVGRVTATRGTLLRLRTTLRFIQSATDVLKMKRDRLAAELNGLLPQLSHRREAERQLIEIYSDLKIALATLGYSTVSSEALGVPKMKVELNTISIMGAMVPKLRGMEKPSIGSIKNLSLYEVAEKQLALIDELLALARIEASIERIAYELMKVNRKVNALEKVIIPTYLSQIRYIEDVLFEEELEDFARIKHIQAVLGRNRT